MGPRSRGLPDEELFMSHPIEDCDSPTIEPLRIFQPQSPKPHQPSSERFRYPPPPVSSSPAPSSSTVSSFRPSAAGYATPPTRPSFPLPPGASSSAAPLPYPVDDEQILPQATSGISSSRPSHPPYPSDRRDSSGGRPQANATSSYSSYSNYSNYNDTSPRFNSSPVDKKQPGLAERRGTGPTSLSPTSPVDGDELFAKIPIRPVPPNKIPEYQNHPADIDTASNSSCSSNNSHHSSHQSSHHHSGSTNDSGMNRFASTASTSTTRANRGSPPPPETPIVEPGHIPGGGIEARYAAAGISGTATLNSLQSPSAAAAQRIAQYGRPVAASQAAPPVPRPWTPTESPETQPHVPVYHGNNQVQSPTPSASSAASGPGSHPALVSHHSGGSSGSAGGHSSSSHSGRQTSVQVSVLEQDFQRMQASTPPPAYTSVNPNAPASFANEKQQAGQSAAQVVHPAVTATAAVAGPSTAAVPITTAAAVPAAAPVPAPVTAPVTTTPAPQPAQIAQVSVQATPPQQQQQQQQQQYAPATTAADNKQALNGGNPLASPVGAHNVGHPAFANDRPVSVQTNGAASVVSSVGGSTVVGSLGHTPSVLQGLQSPPPLPEGWISHLDQNSGQYYYIHLATQATQWEFPKGPNPLHHDPTPLSPATSTYGNPLASPFGKTGMAGGLVSPLYPPTTPGYAESITSMAAASTVTPSAAGFVGPPPSAGVDMYRIAPSNGVYFGPNLRYVNMDVERGIWLGSILIVTDAPQPPTIHIHRSVDLSPNPRQLVACVVSTHQRWTFYKYEVDLEMSEHGTERWTYAVTSHLGCTRYEFVVAGRHELGWRFLAHSGNDFAPATSQTERSRLGGLDFMWKDVLQKNVECGGFHVQLGLGNQIYGDRLWREVPLLQQWLAISGRENRKNVAWTARHEEDVTHAYFHYYTSHFDQPFLREAFAQIPHILQVNDHDIFDGFGSYPDYMQQTAIFKNIGRIAIEMYLLFQHHTTIEILRNVHTDRDLFTVTGAGWHFVKYLGPAVVVVGPDCRSERTQTRVLAGPTYQGLFPKVALLPPSVQHCLWMLSVPVVYPRMETVETLANTFQTGKKAVNTTYNLVGKLTSSVAGVVGGREVVQQGFSSVKKAIGKSGLMGNMLNNFGEFGLTEELRDLWTHESKDLERTYLIRTLQGISQQKGIRMTFLSGDVHACGAGLLHDPTHPSDHKTMYQIISSPIVGAPASGYMLKLLHNNRLLYVPQNGHPSTHEVSDTKEDMMEIFQLDASGAQREHKKLMNRRNYVAVVAYDADALAGNAAVNSPQGLNKLSLAVDYVVQGDGSFSAPTKYGPVIIPHLEFGH